MEKTSYAWQATQLENWLVKFHKDLPHLPKEWSKWLATYAHVFVILGIIFWVIGWLGTLSTFLTLFSSPIGSWIASVWGRYGWWNVWGNLVISLAFLILFVILLIKAYHPLKSMQKKGWNLLFYVNILGVLHTIISIVLYPSSMISGVVWVIIGLYVLFEVREYFVESPQSTGESK